MNINKALHEQLKNATPEEKKKANEIISTVNALVKQGKTTEAMKYLTHLQKTL